MRFIAGVHEFWYRLTDGLIGGNFVGCFPASARCRRRRRRFAPAG